MFIRLHLIDNASHRTQIILKKHCSMSHCETTLIRDLIPLKQSTLTRLHQMWVLLQS